MQLLAEHPWVGGLLCLATLSTTVLFAGLWLCSRQQRQQSENRLHANHSLDRLLASISTNFTTLRTTEVNAAIRHALQAMGRYLEADRAYVVILPTSAQSRPRAHEWCSKQVRSQREVLQQLNLSKQLPWLVKTLAQLESLTITTLADLPPQAERELRFFKQQGIESFIVVPLVSRNQLVGFVQFDAMLQPRQWPQEGLTLLRVFSDILANAISRKKMDEELWRHRHNLEEIVAERTSDLQLANRELESFSYSVSHDLRSPLRAISGFAQMLMEDVYEQLDKNGRNTLERIREASERMGSLIDDLLALSRVARHEINQETINLSNIATEITNHLKTDEPERQVAFIIHSGLTARGDPTLLRAVLENLIGNAWKYTRNTPKPRISFGMDKSQLHETFFVKDNGAGFDMKFADKLFGAFQRLHAKTEFEGSGIGLATVARIIERHGGRVWAKGEEGRGAIFFFTLPKAARVTGPRRSVEDVA